jgi:hypothetical protein
MRRKTHLRSPVPAAISRRAGSREKGKDAMQFDEKINLPTDFAVPILTGRPELLSLVPQDRTLNVEETRAVLHAMSVIVKTINRIEREERSLIHKVVENAKGLRGQLEALVLRAEEASKAIDRDVDYDPDPLKPDPDEEPVEPGP